MTAPSETARRLGQAWALYANEMLASVDARCGGQLTRECAYVRGVREVLAHAVATGDYASTRNDVRQAVFDVPAHVGDKHPEYQHLFSDDPGPAALALRDQVEAARREAEVEFGPK